MIIYLPACDTRAEWVITDGNLLIHNGIREVVFPSCHRADEDGDGVRLG